jgi:A/G-specific adenine glycosylase
MSVATVSTSPRSLGPEARAAVLAWFDARGRAIAFRRTRDPYAILVSEVMAQQTQIARVVPAWRRFLVEFPTVGDLAAASPAQVLRAWRGMGYDRRARNLHRAARTMVAQHGGRVPGSLAALEALPGIGPYTARAVAAIAFGLPVGAVDTNVNRVLSRSLGLTTPRAAEVQAAADASVHPTRPGDWTHALMDIGATLCRPSRTECDSCPLRAWCLSTGPSPANVGRSPRRSAQPPAFPSTTRWLRGRILDRLRAAHQDDWTTVSAPIGVHGTEAVDRALAALDRDGVIERDQADPRRARLPLA